jgi:hypothetical protein
VYLSDFFAIMRVLAGKRLAQRSDQESNTGLRNTPSEAKNIKHTLVIPHKHTRASFEMLLAFHYDLQPNQPAEDGVESTSDDVVDIISPPHEGKRKGHGKAESRTKAEAAYEENVMDMVSDERRCPRETVEEVGGEAEIGQRLQDERKKGHAVGLGCNTEQSLFGDRTARGHVRSCMVAQLGPNTTPAPTMACR